MLFDVIADAAMDSVRLLPFLFLAFLILELLEHYSGKLNKVMLARFRKAGPLLGALLGCIPECGIPILGANLFAASMISPGTLLSVFLSTSDDALLILMSTPGESSVIPQLLGTKLIIAIVAGYVIDLFFAKYFENAEAPSHHVHSCDCCEGNSNLFIHALKHTVNLFSYIFLFTLVLNLLLEMIGFSKLASLLLKDSYFQPILTAVIGFIPSCASSILLTKLYIQGILSFSSFISGLCASTGVGLVVLAKLCPKRKLLLKILITLVLISIGFGILLSLLL